METTTFPTDGTFSTVAPWPGKDDGSRGRKARGFALAATTPFIKVAGGWLTPSQSKSGLMYRLARDEDGVFCECPDYTKRGTSCKHAFGLEVVLQRQQLDEAVKARLEGRPGAKNGHVNGHAAGEHSANGHHSTNGHSADGYAVNGHAGAVVVDEPEPELVPELEPAPMPPTQVPDAPMPKKLDRAVSTGSKPKKTRKGKETPDSTLYNLAQENEARHFIKLLWDLTSTVQPLERKKRGRKPADIQKVLYGLIHRVYTEKSGRRAYSELDIASGVMNLGKLPSRVIMTGYMEKPELTPILEHLVAMSAVPLSPLETGIAIDSTAFGTTIRDEPWALVKWGTEESRKAFTGSTWTKAHFMTGVNTGVITAALATDSPADSGDSPQLPKLLAITNQHFNIERVYADGAYQDIKAFRAIADIGAQQFIPFEERNIYHSSRTADGRLWNSLLSYYREHQDEFYANYHKRSNVESTNSAVKKLLGNLTRSLCPTARINEALIKAISYNITRIVHAIYSDGIEPVFGE